jgi:hypothetical protein
MMSNMPVKSSETIETLRITFRTKMDGEVMSISGGLLRRSGTLQHLDDIPALCPHQSLLKSAWENNVIVIFGADIPLAFCIIEMPAWASGMVI